MSVDYTKLLDGNSLKAIRTYITTYYQPVNANLTSISGLATNVTGLIKMTNGVASLDGTSYAPLASPTFTGTVTLPTSVKIGTSTSTGLVKYTNGVLSIDTSSYKTDYRYRPISVEGNQKLATTNSTALNFLNITGYNVVFEWDSTANGLKAKVDLSGYQPLDADLTAIASLTATRGFLKKTSTNTWSLGSLSASDIPNLDASKITSGTFADARIASASTWNAKYTKPSGGIPASDLAESYILTSARGANNGVASLGADGKIPESQLPASVTSGMEYKGTFDATLGSTISGLETGWYYICSTAGTKNPDGTTGPSDGYEIGDWAVYNGSSDGWAKIDNSDQVSSVCGKTGVVTLAYTDITGAANDADVVHKTGNETIFGDKNFRGNINFSTGEFSLNAVILKLDGNIFTSYNTSGLSFRARAGGPDGGTVTFQGDGKIIGIKGTSPSTVGIGSYLQLPDGKGTSSNPAIIATLDDIGSTVSLVTTTGSESITVGSDTLTLVTRDTDQTITGDKNFKGTVTFNGGGGGQYQQVSLGSFTRLVTNNSGSQAIVIEALHIKGRNASTTFDIDATTGTFTVGNLSTEISQNGTNTVYDKTTITRNVKPSGTTTPTTYIYTYPDKSGTFAMMSDVQNTYTEQEALDILTGTAS